MTFSPNTTTRFRRALAVGAIGLSALALNVGSASASTPITVYGVCHLSSALGPVYQTNANGYPIAYWDNNEDGIADFMAISTNGDTAVDAAGVFNSTGEVVDVALCTQRSWTPATRVELHPARYANSVVNVENNAYVSARIGGINPIGPDYPDGSDF